MERSREIGHDKARILLALRVLRLRDDPSGTAPRLSRTIPKTTETTSRFPCLGVLNTGSVKLLLDPLHQACISLQANDIEETLLLAPLQDLIPTESAVPADDDLNVLPPRANHAHDAREFLRHSLGRVNIRACGASRTKGSPRSRCTAADNNSSRNAHGRTVPPACHAARCPSHPHPARSAWGVPGSW